MNRSMQTRVALLTGMVAAATLFAAPAVGAADFYVNSSSTSCSDTGPGTQISPYCTISAALTAHHDAGTAIIVLPGVYREQVTVPASGAAGAPIILKAQGAAGQPVVVDGTDDFSNPALWSQSSGDVWLASSVTWSPRQVFADGARLTPSTSAPDALPPRSFTYVAGSGLYVNAGGGNPAGHGAQVGHRAYGFFLSSRSWVRIDGFNVTRCEDRCVQLTSDTNVEVVRCGVTLAGRFGLQVNGGSANRIASNTVSDNADHGISMVSGATQCTIEDNESSRNVFPTARQSNGLYMFGAPGNVIQRNRWHDNQDTGEHMQSGSNDNVSLENVSWNNGDHGYDTFSATGNIHVGDVAYGNFKDGFSFEGNSPGNQLHNSIAVDNGLTTNEFDLWVENTSTTNFVSNDNIFWNSTAQAPVKYNTTIYPNVPDYSAASGQDSRARQSDPRFVDAPHGNFHLMAGSPAIDDANSGAPHWPATDAAGSGRSDDPGMPNDGIGPVSYADRGAFEFQAPAGNQPPIARLTMTPSSGQDPLAVTADASASTDPEGGRIMSYRFDFGDGVVVGPQSGPVAHHTYRSGQFTASVVVTDSVGATGTASASVNVMAGVAEWVGNPSFEVNTTGWAPVGGATMQRVAGGADGNFSLRVGAPTLGLEPFGITDDPNWVAATSAAGLQFQLTAWVRAETGTGLMRLRVRESNGSDPGSWVESGAVWVSSSWQQLGLSYVTQRKGSTLDVEIVEMPALVVTAFRVDGISIRSVPANSTATLASTVETQDAAPVEALGALTAAGMAPNPVPASGAQLTFSISREGPWSVELYDLSGRRVRRVASGSTAGSGTHVVAIDGLGDDGAPLHSGAYYYLIQTAGGPKSGRFVIMR